MKLIITDNASKWFQNKYALQTGDGIKLYGKTVQPRDVRHGPWQGFTPEKKLINAAIVEKKDGINYHINFEDAWFFSGLITLIDYRINDEQPLFNFQRETARPTTINTFSAEDVDASTGASSKFEDYWE
ncbi:MAG: Fe-S cluster assembly protein HesB [Limosilactobacillus sp.]|jgi:uncharacterized protein YneR|uniref:HesB/YadR/YfhF family protein n=1 Tax=Limosilactobacillus sp. TaxID=2773925 RepID=UPI0025C72078|nr:Fe-S cluster assembly protein HesB [Limosilactobacillus sp.]MCI1974851.1 Fe-S cluster assembly protein HesB [Limosilactobacillus sp.]MCI2031107.1 Fe-S cluster assembly protein HesB [Limosilactobacillus sp.]